MDWTCVREERIIKRAKRSRGVRAGKPPRPAPGRLLPFLGLLSVAAALPMAAYFSVEGAGAGGLAVLLCGLAAILLIATWQLKLILLDQAAWRTADERETEFARLLLDGFEGRGIGWLWRTDADNRIVYSSDRMSDVTGRSKSQMLGQPLTSVLPGSPKLGAALISRQPFANLEMEIRTRHKTSWIEVAGDPVLDADGQCLGYRGFGLDISDSKRSRERLTSLANIDVLTGLPNRGRVRQLLGEALSACREKGGLPCGIMFLDLDGFKPVNDTFGHPKGDLILKGVSKRLVKEVGAAGEVGRMGGDEFAVILAQVPNRDALDALAKRIIDAVAEPFRFDNQEVRVGISIGCASGPNDGQTVDDLIHKADLALYQAKAKGRSTCCYFSAEMQSRIENKKRMEHDMREGIEAQQFRLLYQPLINAASQTLVGFEALVRWHHPVRGVVPPLDFIPLAEETGLIIPLGDWIIREACQALSHWPSDISVAVNVSPRQLVASSLTPTVKEALTKHRLAASRLELEVTESVFLGESAGALDVLKRLRGLGVGIALDDFGTGYSSLGYLNKAVFHKLKIDGSFVREAGHLENQETIAIIQSIVSLARSFRMTVTAEGVETSEDFQRMRDLGCHQVQGYLFGRPLSFEDANSLVQGGRLKLAG